MKIAFVLSRYLLSKKLKDIMVIAKMSYYGGLVVLSVLVSQPAFGSNLFFSKIYFDSKIL